MNQYKVEAISRESGKLVRAETVNGWWKDAERVMCKFHREMGRDDVLVNIKNVVTH